MNVRGDCTKKVMSMEKLVFKNYTRLNVIKDCINIFDIKKNKGCLNLKIFCILFCTSIEIFVLK